MVLGTMLFVPVVGEVEANSGSGSASAQFEETRCLRELWMLCRSVMRLLMRR